MVLKKEGGERQEYLTCLPQLPAADGVPLYLHLPACRLGNCLHPIRDLVHKIKCRGKGCGEKKSNWREGEGEKRHRGRGKGQGHGGWGGFNALPEIRRVSTQTVWQTKPRERSDINQQTPQSLIHLQISEGPVWILNKFEFLLGHILS